MATESSKSTIVLLRLVDEQAETLLAVASGRLDARQAEPGYRARHDRLAVAAAAIGQPHPYLRFASIWAWVALCRAELHDDEARRVHLEALAADVREAVGAAGGPVPGWTVEMYERPSGQTPFKTFATSLSRVHQAALFQAVNLVLKYEGPDVVKTEWGKNLREGLFELRIRRTAAQIARMYHDRAGSASDLSADSPEDVLLRVYFHPHGDKVILLLAGLDKGAHPNWEDGAIAEARRLLREWAEGEKRAKKVARRSK